jgi:hypothetical protein
MGVEWLSVGAPGRSSSNLEARWIRATVMQRRGDVEAR